VLKLVDLILLHGVELNDFKIHCATGIVHPPLDAFLAGKWKEWQEGQNQENFKCSQILSLIYRGNSRWLFAGVYVVLGVQKGHANNPNGFTYSTKELDKLDDLTGRVIVSFNKTFRQSYLRGDKYAHELLVSEILRERLTIGEFPGFNRVLLSYSNLCTVVRHAEPSWHAALANVSGVYVVTDNSSGKQYIGSAYGGAGIWQRWAAYAKNGHGGNKELKNLLEKHGQSYASNFQYAIVEVCDLNSGQDFMLDREGHWKDVHRTREFGLNIN
jgi:GIY-YIG catalytic domain